MQIENKEELRLAYEILKDVESREKTAYCEERIRRLKISIRRYTKEQPTDCTRRIIKDRWDSYIELIQFPRVIKTTAQAQAYFEERLRMEIKPSQYDCTGQPFTVWYKTFRRRGRMWAYHYVALDV